MNEKFLGKMSYLLHCIVWMSSSLLSLCFIKAEEIPQYTLIEDQLTTHILTPSLSKRETAKIRLKNGLEAYIISDPESPQSGAALTVMVGSSDDPEKQPGLAHLIEHMILRGSPLASEGTHFDSFLAEHGGVSNAFTKHSQTSYLFTIEPSAFVKALEKFSFLVRNPFFDEVSLKKEIAAIDDEFRKSCRNEKVRRQHVLNDVTKNSPNDFSIGNIESLKNLTGEDLKTWYKGQYSSDKMRLIIMAPLPIKELITAIVENFSEFPKSLPVTEKCISENFSEKLHNQLVYIEPIKHVKQLQIIWELTEEFAEELESHPEALVTYILGDEGNKSLLSYLKREKLATSLRCSSSYRTPRSLQISLNVDLTPFGAKNILRVIGRCFDAIGNMKERKLPKRIFDELQMLSLFHYQYQSREEVYDHLKTLSMQVGNESMDTFPERSMLIKKYDDRAATKLINALTPYNAYYIITAPATISGVHADKMENLTNTSYAIKPINEDTILAWKNSKGIPDIDLPDPNPYAPSKISAKKPQEKSLMPPKPLSVLNDSLGSFFYANDSVYGLPFISIHLHIKTPIIDPKSIESHILADLYIAISKETLGSLINTALTAGIQVAMNIKDNGLSIVINGCSAQSARFLDDLLTKIVTLQFDEKTFKAAKLNLLKRYQEHSKEPALAQLLDQFSSVIHPENFLPRTKSPQVNKINFSQFQKFTKSLFKESYVEGMFYGNSSKEEVRAIIDRILATLHSKPYTKDEQWVKKAENLPQTPTLYDSKSKLPTNAALLVIQAKPYSNKTAIAQKILMQAIREPFYRELRTRQQTGYVVITAPRETDSHLYDIFAVESSSHDGRDLIARYELFLEGFSELLVNKTFSLESFECIKRSVLHDLKSLPKNPNEMGAYLNTLAFVYNGNFNRSNERIAACESLTYDDFITIALETISKANKCRFAFTFSGNPVEEPLRYRKISTLKAVIAP